MMTKTTASRILLILTMVSLCTVVTVAGELVVIESRSGRYPAGKLIDEETPIKLAEGETVTFLAQDGAMYKHAGPYEGSPRTAKEADDKGLMVALKTLVHGKKDSETSVGAVRGGDAGEVDAGGGAPAWSLLIDGAGEQCVAAGAAAGFWRADTDAELLLSLKSLSGGASAELAWAVGARELAWPEAIPRIDGAIYLIRLGNEVSSRHLVLHEIPEAVAAKPDAVAWLSAKGCRRQAAALLAELEGS